VSLDRGAHRGAVALGLLLAAGPARAEFTLRSEVDSRKVGVEDQVQLTITVEGAGAPDEIPLPPLKNLELVGGPFQSTQVSIVNGRMSQSRSLSYVLQPRAVGSAEIGAVRAGGQSAPAIAIEVVKGRLAQPRPQRQDPFAGSPFGDPFRDPLDDIFGRAQARGAAPRVEVEAQPSRTRLRVGEPFVLTYWLYTQTSVSDLQFKDAPQFAGFWVEELDKPQTSTSGEPATLDGRSYRRFPVLRKLLFPTKAGSLTIPAATFRIGLARTGFFDAGGTLDRATRPVTITVEPLPDVAGFGGAVGKFKASASLDRDQVPLGEAATLRFKVEGTGNLKWLDRPPAVGISGAKVFPPQAKSEMRTTAEGITGSRTWEFVVVPETSGTLEIPSIPFAYFDPGAGKVVTTATGPLALRTLGASAAAGAAPSAPASARAVGSLPLRSDLGRPASDPLAGRALAGLVGVALALHAGLLAAGRVRVGGFARAGRTASSRSVRAALADLERASRDGLSKEQAASLVEKALDGAFGAPADVDDSERARLVRGLLDDVRFLRYAPQLGDYSDKVRELAARATDAVRRWA
jgi:hypothetical protein